MKVTLFMAMSLNGIIARENGSEDFLSHENWKVFSSLVEEIGNFVVGRKTYEAVKGWTDGYTFDDFPQACRVIVTHSSDYVAPEGYEIATTPEDALRLLESKGFTRALVTGGSGNNASFVKAGLVDEVLLNIEPIIIGKGIPLVALYDSELRLQFVETKKLAEGILQLRYTVKK